VPGIDFTNDPLLQGRNFSYLDTQLKRLGSPNFTHLPVNAPRCPFRHFQQDGHMAFYNPKGRANYEPNSWGADGDGAGGPREDPKRGFQTYPAAESGEKRRIRPESFADHYSQARQFYISQTPVERAHIGDAIVFELSKCDRADIRERIVGHLMNIHDELAAHVAEGLGLAEMPKAALPATPVNTSLPPSDALSILKNGPKSFAGRKVGALVTDGVDMKVLGALKKAVEAEGAMLKIVAPKIFGVTADDGSTVEADEKIDGGPSVVFDAVAVLPSAEGAAMLARMPAARDFVTDAFAHYKFVAHNQHASALFAAACVSPDGGFIALDGEDAAEFVTACRQLRFWNRQGA
jgi:catalase